MVAWFKPRGIIFKNKLQNNKRELCNLIKRAFSGYDMFNISQRESSTGFLNRKKLNSLQRTLKISKKYSKGKFLSISHVRTSIHRSS